MTCRKILFGIQRLMAPLEADFCSLSHHRVFASFPGSLPPQVSASVDSKYIASTEEVDWVRWNFRPVPGGKWMDGDRINGLFHL